MSMCESILTIALVCTVKYLHYCDYYYTLGNDSQSTPKLIAYHYLTIQTYRYGDSFTYIQTVERESLLDCQVFRFSLQPLLENAIFHGIGGRRKPGRIQLSVRTKDNDLFIHITDNGIGIPQSQIDRILSCDKETDEDQLFRKVGIRNINRRLKLEYGDTYGIFIQSQVDSYTEVIVRSPLIYPDNMKEQGDEQPCTQ